MRTDFTPLVYYPTKPDELTGTMEYLNWFRFFVRNRDKYIRVPTPDTQTKFPNNQARLFFILRSTEQTHMPCVYTVNANVELTYQQWCEHIRDHMDEYVTAMDAILNKELRRYLDWYLKEFIGWTNDGLVQNPQENQQAFRFEGHFTSAMGKARN